MKGKLLARGSAADVFEWDRSRVLKLYRKPWQKLAAFREALIHGAVEHYGLPVPRVWEVQQVGARWGVVFDRVAGDYVWDLDRVARLHIAIHCHVIRVWDEPIFISLKTRLSAKCQDSDLGEAEKAALLAGLTAKTDGNCLCHGDLHPGNILAGGSEPMIIDWISANRGDPAADVCRSYLVLGGHDNERAASYVAAYCRLSGIPRHSVFEWLPYLSRLGG